ncbi:MAG: DUF3090 family protein [Dehalococcoidia bacterium]
MIDFGLVDAIDAEAIGEPGQRIFRIRVVKGGQYAAIWLEKQELAQLGRSLSQLLAEKSDERGQPVDIVNPVGIFPSNPDMDIQALRISIDFDVDTQSVVVNIDDETAMTSMERPSFSMSFSRSQAISLSSIIEVVVAGGRPLCKLCGQVLDIDGKCIGCPGSNGHAKEFLISNSQED